jgi:phage replication-related protein YjqB (UPF0714/DUF867 family)
MDDKYPNFKELQKHEHEDNYRIVLQDRLSPVLIIAPHGGGIEPYTSKLATSIAGDNFSLYLFEGRKTGHNKDLHITSHHFFEDRLDKVLESADVVLTVHGLKEPNDELIYMGGLDRELSRKISQALRSKGFTIKEYVPGYEGKEPLNICNRGRTGKGVQLELTYTLRKRMDEDVDLKMRFVESIRSVLLKMQ